MATASSPLTHEHILQRAPGGTRDPHAAAKAVVRYSELTSACGLQHDLATGRFARTPEARFLPCVNKTAPKTNQAWTVASGAALAAYREQFAKAEAEQRDAIQAKQAKAEREAFNTSIVEAMRAPIPRQRPSTPPPRDQSPSEPDWPPPASPESPRKKKASKRGGTKQSINVAKIHLVEEWEQKRKKMTDAGASSSWAKCDGASIEPLLAYTNLIDIRYLVGLGRARQPLPPLQALPPEATVPLSVLRRSTGHAGLPVLALSYPWCSRRHPDPKGELLQAVLPLFEAIVGFCDANVGTAGPITWGVMWDFGSFPQHGYSASMQPLISMVGLVEEAKPGEYTTYTSNDTRFEEIREGFFDDRSTVERAKADLGRENIGRWFVHKHVWKLFIDAPLPAITSSGRGGFDNRGWCSFEARLASLITKSELLISLKAYQEAVFARRKMKKGEPAVLTWGAIVRESRAFRTPPITPMAFRKLLRHGVDEGTLSFSEPSDLSEFVLPNYERAYANALPSIAIIDLNQQGWGNDEVAALARMILDGHKMNLLDDLTEVRLSGNRFGDDGMFALLECVHEGAFDRLTVLNVSDNMIGDEGLEALADAIKVGRLGCWSTINVKGNKRVVEQGRRRHVERALRARQELDIDPKSWKSKGEEPPEEVVKAWEELPWSKERVKNRANRKEVAAAILIQSIVRGKKARHETQTKIKVNKMMLGRTKSGRIKL